MGRSRKPENQCACGENDPAMFGERKTKCLKCRRDYKGKPDEQTRAIQWKKAMVILKAINAWKPPRIRNVERHGAGRRA